MKLFSRRNLRNVETEHILKGFGIWYWALVLLPIPITTTIYKNNLSELFVYLVIGLIIVLLARKNHSIIQKVPQYTKNCFILIALNTLLLIVAHISVENGADSIIYFFVSMIIIPLTMYITVMSAAARKVYCFYKRVNKSKCYHKKNKKMSNKNPLGLTKFIYSFLLGGLITAWYLFDWNQLMMDTMLRASYADQINSYLDLLDTNDKDTSCRVSFKIDALKCTLVSDDLFEPSLPLEFFPGNETIKDTVKYIDETLGKVNTAYFNEQLTLCKVPSN